MGASFHEISFLPPQAIEDCATPFKPNLATAASCRCNAETAAPQGLPRPSATPVAWTQTPRSRKTAAVPKESPMTVQPFRQSIRIGALRGSFLLALPLILFTRSAWSEPEWLFDIFEVSGIFLIILAVLGRFWAILYIGAVKNRTVMQDGPYSICRHPLYLFSTLGVLGLGLMLGSLVLTAVLGAATFAILTATARREEAFLRGHFGPAYAAYADRVPLIWPKPSLFRAEPTVTASVAALRVNFADALVFLAFIPLAEFMEGVKEAGLVPTLALF
jgi:protein-S-isoprenylcysteine O-methyltransferase Ste14